MNAAVQDEDLSSLMAGQISAPKSAAPSAPVNLPALDEVGPRYVEHRDDLEGRAALQALQSESSATEKPQAQDRGTSTATWDGSEDPAAAFRKQVGREGSPAEIANFQQMGGQGWAGDKSQVGPTIATVAKDVGKGAVESPRAIVMGARDAFQSMLSGASDLGTWLEKKADIPGLKIDSSGVHVVSGEELQNLHRPFEGDELPRLPGGNKGEPTSVTGGVIRSAAQFVTSMATLGRVFGPMGADLEGSLGHLANMGKSAAAMFAGFDKASGNIADLVEKVPALSNPITSALASDPNDNEAWGRVKNALVGAGFGELQNAILAGLKMFRGAMVAKASVSEESGLPDTPGPEPKGTVQTPAAFKFLGNPDAAPEHPLASMREPDLEADKAARAAAATEGLTPEQVAAMKIPAGSVKPAPQESVPGYTVEEGESHEGTEPGQQAAERTAAGGSPAEGWRDATRIRSEDSPEPLTVYRGGEREVSSGHFDEEALGSKTGHPSSGLGVFFTTSEDEAQQWGNVRPAQLDIRNPKQIPIEDLPPFDSTEEARAYSKKLENQGYDGIELHSQHLGGHDWVVAFHPEQVVHEAQPVTQTSGEPIAGPRVPGATEAQMREPEVYINFARIDTPDDVKRVMSQLADAQKDNIDIAKRGIRSFEQTQLGANFKDAWRTLMDRRQGEPLNAEEQLAGRQLLAQSATKAEALTQMTIENPTPENLFAWRKQMQTHAMIQAEVSGSQAEVARSLGAMRIPVSGQDSIKRMAAITSQLDQLGGLQTNMDFLQATKTLIDSGRLEDLGNVAEKSLYAKTRDALITAWTNGLLTNPLTHVKVNLSNIGTIALRLGETRLAESMDAVTDTNGVPAGEAAQTAAGLISGVKDSFRYLGKLAGLPVDAPEQNPTTDAAQAFKTGHYSVGETQPDWAQNGQEASNALSIADNGGWAGKATDMLSSVVTSPGRALAGEHEFYRSIGMRMELNRYAYRQAISELNAGKIQDGDLAGRVAQLVENPPPNMTTKAVDGMTYQTFTDAPGKLAEILGNLREAYPSVRVILPFYKIPSRIMSFTFERSPLAPLMAGWRADIAAGGARQSMALAKTGLGSMVMLAASDAVLNGQITGQGPADRGQRQALMDEGWQPYSVKTPSGRWVQYNRLETVGSSMALAADITETTRDYFTAVNKDDPNVEKLTAAGIAAVANNVTSKTYFEGVANFFDTLSDPRANAEKTLKSLAGSLVPAGVGALASLMDPYQRATYSMIDAIKARTPGVSKSLPPVTNVWGEPVRKDSGFGKPYDAFVPFASHRPGDEPIDQEIIKQGMHVTLPPQKTSINGATVDLGQDPELYHRYVELAGNGLKSPAWGMGAKDLLNDVVSGNHPLSTIYNMKSDGPDGGKALMLRGLIEQYRRDAATQLMQETPALASRVNSVKEHQAQLKMPVLAQGTP